MASIRKLSRDKRKKNTAYYIQFLDHEGNRRTTKGCSDRGVTQAKAAKIETVVQQIKLGIADVAELDSMLGHKQSEGLEEHLLAFKQSLQRKQNTEKYVSQMINQIRLVLDGIGSQSLDELDADAAEVFLVNYCEKNDVGHRTYNHYLQSIDTFGNWLASPKRQIVDRNPFAGIPRRNAETDIRHKRRALTSEEIALVIKTARNSDYTVDRYEGSLRARLYLLSYMTGLRKGELASLTPRSFDLDAPQPTLTVEASASKHRKKDTLPLHSDLIPLVREWITDMANDEPLFPKLAKKQAHRMIRRDLETAGIPYKTEKGIADFHAAGRHTHITGLLKSGVSLVEAKELARHSDVRMTMQYTHIGLDDQAKAVNQLPSLDLPASEVVRDCLHIVCTECGADGQSGATTGSNRQKRQPKEKRRNPNDSKGFGAVRQPVTPVGNHRQKVGPTGFEPATSRL